MKLPIRAASVALALLALVGPASAAEPAPAAFEPDPSAAGAPELQGVTWVGRGADWTIWLRQVEPGERLNFIERTTGFRVDPFAAPPGKPEPFVTFLLVIENSGEGPLELNPVGCWLTPNRKHDMQSPVGFDKLSFEFRVAGLELPPAYARARSAIFDLPRTIAPGTTASGLLVYEQLDPHTRRFVVDVPLGYGAGESVRISAPYRRVKHDASRDEDRKR